MKFLSFSLLCSIVITSFASCSNDGKVRLQIKSNYDDAGTFSGAGRYEQNESVSVSVNVNDGYVFLGWYLNDDCVSSNFTYSFDMGKSNVALEARFELAKYSLFVQTNNPKSGLVLLKNKEESDYQPSDLLTIEYKTKINLVAYSISDAKFLGWYEDTIKVSNDATYSFTMPSRDLSLVAKWDCFTIFYSMNGGTNNISNPETFSSSDGIVPLFEPSRIGYTFVGWLFNGEYVNAIDSSWNSNVVLTAVWAATEFSIDYRLNGGQNNPDNPDSYNVEETFVLSNPSREGYDFVGWFTDKDYTKAVSKIDYTFTGDLTLYAKWVIHSYSIVYNLEEGIDNSLNPKSYTINDNFVLVSVENPNPGYSFAYWVDQDGNRIDSLGNGKTGNLELTPIWTSTLSKLVLKSGDNSLGTVCILQGTGYSFEMITIEAKATGNNAFDSWVCDGEVVSTEPTYSFKMPAHDVTLTAFFISELDLNKTSAISELTNYGNENQYREKEKSMYLEIVLTGVNDISNAQTLSSVETLLAKCKRDIDDLLTKDEYLYLETAGAYPTFGKKHFWTTVTYGIYPQSHVGDDELIAELNSSAILQPNGWYKHRDTYYASITAVPSAVSDAVKSYSDGKPILAEKTWFKCDLITWYVLLSDSNQYFLFSKNVLDLQKFSNLVSYSTPTNNYETSDLRYWLNNTFYNNAFFLNQTFIKNTEIDNSAKTTNDEKNTYACGNTSDNVFLLSYEDLINSDYRFSTNPDSMTSSRAGWVTDYVLALGCPYSTDAYWGRSPYYPNEYGIYVWGTNSRGALGAFDTGDKLGIRPAIIIEADISIE